MVPSSQHDVLEDVLGDATRKLDNYRFEYLAGRMSKNEFERSIIVEQLFKEYASKIATSSAVTSLDKKIIELSQSIEALKKNVETAETKEKILQQEKELEIIKISKKKELKSTLNDLNHIGNGIAAVIGIADPKAAQILAVTNSSVLQIVDSVSSLNNLSGVALFGQYAIIASGSVQLLKAWGVFGGKQKDGLGLALKEISKQIQRMQERMDARFDRIENQLYLNHKEIIRNFSAINNSIGLLDSTLSSVYKKVIQIEEKIKDTQIQENLKQAEFFLENELESIDRECIRGKLSAQEAQSCFEKYQAFVENRSHSVLLTKVGSSGEWNEFIEWQINYYADLTYSSKKLSNPAVLKDLNLRRSLILSRNSSLDLMKTQSYHSFKHSLDIRSAELKNVFTEDMIDDSIDEIETNISTMRKHVSAVQEEEFRKTKISQYISDLRAISNEYEQAINERLFEIRQVSRSDVLADVYIKNLNLTINTLKNDQHLINSFLKQYEKKSWMSLIHSSIDFPIIVKPKNELSGSARPVVISFSQLKEFNRGMNLSAFIAAKDLMLFYEFSTASKRIQGNPFGDSPPASGFGVHLNPYHMFRYAEFAGHVSSMNLSGSITHTDANGVSKQINLIHLTDRNESCRGGFRVASWFKNAVDPYSMSVLMKKGGFDHKVYNESCGLPFRNLSGVLLSHSTSSNFEVEKEREVIDGFDEKSKSEFAAEMIKKTSKKLSTDGTFNLCKNLQNNLAKLKGLIFLKYDKSIEADLEKFKKVTAIPSKNVVDLVLSQLEIITLTGKERILSDVSLAINKWHSNHRAKK